LGLYPPNAVGKLEDAELIFGWERYRTLAGEAEGLIGAQWLLTAAAEGRIPVPKRIADDAQTPGLGASMRAADLDSRENLTLRAVQLAGQIARGVLQME